MAAVRIENLRFHGGLNQLHLGTNDIDCAFWVVRDCVFSVSRMTVANIWVSFYQRIPKLIERAGRALRLRPGAGCARARPEVHRLAEHANDHQRLAVLQQRAACRLARRHPNG